MCKQSLPRAAFYKSAANKSGLQSRCISCTTASYHDEKRKDPQAYLARKREAHKAWRHANKDAYERSLKAARQRYYERHPEKRDQDLVRLAQFTNGLSKDRVRKIRRKHHRAKNQRRRENLSDVYLKFVIYKDQPGLTSERIPNQLVELTRAYIKIKRQLKEQKK